MKIETSAQLFVFLWTKYHFLNNIFIANFGFLTLNEFGYKLWIFGINDPGNSNFITVLIFSVLHCV